MQTWTTRPEAKTTTTKRPAAASALLAVAALALLAAGTASADASPTAPAIVARSIEFHGGEVVARSEVALTLTSRSGSSRIEAWRDGGLFDYTVAAPAEGEPERKVRFTNREGKNQLFEWRGGKPREVTGRDAERAQSWLVARVYFPFLPFRLADPGLFFTDLGLERWGERELHKVKVTFAPGSSPDADDEYLYWFDPENGRLEQFAYSFHTGDGGLRLRRATDFERVGGVLFSDQENLGVDGKGPNGEALAVDLVTPDYARTALHPVSTVELSAIEVRPLE